MVGIFITWTLANIINQNAPLHAPYPALMMWMYNTYQHTIVCANLYYRKVTLVMWFSTGVYVCEYTLESPKELSSPDICLPACLNSLRTTAPETLVKRLLAVMQMRDEGTKHRKEEESCERNLE